jgi:hypothetical protein
MNIEILKLQKKLFGKFSCQEIHVYITGKCLKRSGNLPKKIIGKSFVFFLLVYRMLRVLS